MVMAAGLGTRLRPLTYHLPKALIPVANRPVMHHLLNLLRRHGFREIGCNISYLPEAITEYFGDGSALGVAIRWSIEDELLGTAGGTKALGDFWGREPVLVTSGDGLHDVDLSAVVEQHRRTGAKATLVVKPVDDPSQYGVVITDPTTRVVGFQEKPAPGTAQSNLANCGIYVIEPEILDSVPEGEYHFFEVWERLVDEEPGALHAFTTMSYWNDVGDLAELRNGTLDAVTGKVKVEAPGDEIFPGVRCEDGASIDVTATLEGPLVIGKSVTIESDAVVRGPGAIGAHSSIGRAAQIKGSVLLPGSVIPNDGVAIAGIFGDASTLASSVLRYPAAASERVWH
jgi:NDP-sugar pyrophosphorylase family protein